MEDFRQQFLADAVINLRDLRRNLSGAAELSDAERREVFRLLHTIKGTAQTFGLSAASRLAHELENILSAENILADKELQSLFVEGVGLLINCLEDKNFHTPEIFAEKIHCLVPKKFQSATAAEILLPDIPGDISECLSLKEKVTLNSAFNDGKNIYVIEVSFPIKSFAVEFRELRQKLNPAGEIVAAFPGAKSKHGDKLGFRLLYVGSAGKTRLNKIAAPYTAKITFEMSPEAFTEDLRGIISKAVAHGKGLAKKLDKDVQFKIYAEQKDQPAEKLKLIFDILLHLIRNAVDHAVENSGGEIEITAQTKENGLHITVADNGRGINLEKVKAKAVEKQIVSADEDLTERATLDLIFQSELSTAPHITEISGRGIGLDAVKYEVEKAGGIISVESRNGSGTSFEIFLPN